MIFHDITLNHCCTILIFFSRQERRFVRKAVLFLATASADAQEEKFWKHKANMAIYAAEIGI